VSTSSIHRNNKFCRTLRHSEKSKEGDAVNRCSSTQRHTRNQREDHGFTLVEILIAIVLVGILSAVVVVGISNLTSKGSSSACAASSDSARAGAVVYYTANAAYPTTLTQMTTSTGSGSTAIPAALTLPSSVTLNTAAITGPPAIAIGMQAAPAGSPPAWKLTMTAGVDGAAPLFVCT
jgi:prepilin-type N-terminal cleavage/methylation domain-containing protein